MFVKQLSVFIENRKGSLEEVTKTLEQYEVNILSISLADTSEYGLLRMIVSKPVEARDVLRQHGFSAMITDVIAVRLQNQVGMLQKLLQVICDADLSIEYMYALASTQIGAMIIKTSDGEAAAKALREAKMEVLEGDMIYSIQ